MPVCVDLTSLVWEDMNMSLHKTMQNDFSPTILRIGISISMCL